MISGDNFEIENNMESKLNENKSIGLISNSDEIKFNYNNEESNNYLKINDSLQLYENQIDSNNNNYLGSEEIFINQKKEIERMKKKNELINSKKETISNSFGNTKNNFNHNNINTKKSFEVINKNEGNSNINEENEENKNDNCENNLENIDYNFDEIQTFNLNDYKNFEYYIFDSDSEYNIEKSNILNIDNTKWKPINEDFPLLYGEDGLKNLYNFIEMNKIAIRCNQEIDFGERNLELTIDFNLEQQSELWIFTRSFVNKSINESLYFDEKSENIDINDIFNKYTSLIKIFKDHNLKRYFVSFGTFYHEINENNKLYYKSFLKRQIIDYSNDNKNNNEDKSEFSINIIDLGEETITANIFLNNKIKSDIINGNFFLPINKKAKILIYGKGKSVQLKDLSVRTYDKKKCTIKTCTQFEMESDALHNCECCSIF